ncbi:MAG: two-component sensor histidine kinase, partial [Chloroflexi bacterium]
GLGLAIAEWIVQAHNGTIKVDSGPTGGTKFSIELPATS